MSQTVVILFIAFLAYVQGSPHLILGSSCNCPDKSLPPCPDSGACAAVTCLTGRSCEPCPCNCNIARCVRKALPPFPGPRCPCQKEDCRPPCPDFGGCAAITCGPGFSCEPCPCDCRTGQCVPSDRR
ncbi:uncharacterized protein [Porites lutea]|uniref:uncharacterized protein n=1 Tax=Porites lutea TaxID=51062 RepID=UPI003CC6962E